MMTFPEYMKNTEDGPRGLDPVFVQRLVDSGSQIDSLNSLVTFAKTRWPNNYSRDWRKPLFNMPFGRDAMQALWARYLEANETASPDGSGD